MRRHKVVLESDSGRHSHASNGDLTRLERSGADVYVRGRQGRNVGEDDRGDSGMKTKTRRKPKKSQFGLPGKRKYPMPDKAHAVNAKARAK